MQNAGFVTALEYSDMRKMVFRISSGSTELEYVNFQNATYGWTFKLNSETFTENKK